MTSFKRIGILTLFLAAIGTILTLRYCKRHDVVEQNDLGNETVKINNKIHEVIRTDFDTVYITKTFVKDNYVPTFVTVTDTIYMDVSENVDTQAILRDYFSKRYLADTVEIKMHDISLGLGIIQDTISRNSILSRSILWKMNYANFYTNTIVKEPLTYNFYWGFGIGINKEDYIGNLSTSLLFQDKQHKKIYQVGIGLQNNSNTQRLQPFLYGGLYWRI